jgi:hypothetical protein
MFNHKAIKRLNEDLDNEHARRIEKQHELTQEIIFLKLQVNQQNDEIRALKSFLGVASFEVKRGLIMHKISKTRR